MNKYVLGIGILSLGLNVGWLLQTTSHSFRAPSGSDKTAAAQREDASKTVSREALLAALRSGDAAALAALGLSPNDIRDFKLGRIYAHYLEIVRAKETNNAKDGKYWKTNSRFRHPGLLTAEDMKARRNAERELAEAQQASLGSSQVTASRYNFLPVEKQAQLAKIERDYSEMRENISLDISGFSMPSDEAKLALLRKEEQQDIAAALSPEEREQSELRLSPTASTVGSSYGDAIQSEDVYKKVFTLQKAYDDQYRNLQNYQGILTPAAAKARSDAQIALDQQIRLVIGDDNLVAAAAANDPDRGTMVSLESRFNLPASTTDQVMAMRENYAEQAQAIARNSNLAGAEQHDQLTALGQNAIAELTNVVGADAAQSLATRFYWLTLLHSGNAFTTNNVFSPNGHYNMSNPIVAVRPTGAASSPSVRSSVGY